MACCASCTMACACSGGIAGGGIAPIAIAALACIGFCITIIADCIDCCAAASCSRVPSHTVE